MVETAKILARHVAMHKELNNVSITLLSELVEAGFQAGRELLLDFDQLKQLLIGEFEEKIEMVCPECDQENWDSDCPICDGQIEWLQPVTISWTTIKKILTTATEQFRGLNK